ncbi:hypothetical protein [Gephyromycinifex aptenodytis]|uniref:hypothetical protein n=1 Tax=Gephyromycinifex aptenodytis TaxID=2716227 RepID=UPI00144899E5|nr:hypothetical protein [Gephyromycinifex aptenodytis]
MDPERGVWRLARIGVVTGAGLGLSVCGHLLGGGALPHPGALTLVGIVTLLVATLLTGARVPAVRLGVVLTLLQAISHLVFHHASGSAPVSLMAGPGGHLHAGIPTAHAAHAAHHVAHHAAHLSGGAGFAGTHGLTAPMLATHLVATLITTWFMASGEQRLWRAVARFFTITERVRLAICTPSWQPNTVIRTHPVTREVGLGMSLRGPPSRYALAS